MFTMSQEIELKCMYVYMTNNEYCHIWMNLELIGHFLFLGMNFKSKVWNMLEC